MARSKRAKALDITQKTKQKVWERDGYCCIICGNPEAMPNSHYIRRSQGGLGIEQNVGTMCAACHHEYDNGFKYAERIKERFREHLMNCYPDWNEADLYYQKY